MRLFRIFTFCCFILGLLSCTEQTIDSTSKVEEDRPNIIFIFADDWGWRDLSAHGHLYVKTSIIDRLLMPRLLQQIGYATAFYSKWHPK